MKIVDSQRRIVGCQKRHRSSPCLASLWLSSSRALSALSTSSTGAVAGTCVFRHASRRSLAFSGASAIGLRASGPSTNRFSGPLFFCLYWHSEHLLGYYVLSPRTLISSPTLCRYRGSTSRGSNRESMMNASATTAARSHAVSCFVPYPATVFLKPAGLCRETHRGF